MKPLETIKKFDQYLKAQNLSFKGVIIGGSALSILGVITRETQDCDILDPNIPENVQEAAKNFAKKQGLEHDWLNNGPDSLKRDLPKGWRLRLQSLFEGEALNLQTLGRSDLLATKLFAYCDRGFDLADCLKLNPTQNELKDAKVWVSKQDANPDWPDHVEEMFKNILDQLSKG